MAGVLRAVRRVVTAGSDVADAFAGALAYPATGFEAFIVSGTRAPSDHLVKNRGAARLGTENAKRRAVRPDLADAYLGEAISALSCLRAGQARRIREAARVLAQSWSDGGCLWVARTGHSLHTELVG